MKKFLYTALFSLTLSSLIAQVCIPDTTINSSGLFPPGVTNWEPVAIMPNAEIGIPYSEVMQIKAPSDTSVPQLPNPISIDSLMFVKIVGLPGSITYQCDNSRCFWLGGQNGCATFMGTPVAGEEGTYLATIKAYGWVDAGPLGILEDTVEYQMQITVDPTVGLEENKFENSVSISPSPISTMGVFSFRAPGEFPYTFKIVDVTGRTVIKKNGETNYGQNSFEINRLQLPDGVYIYLFESGEFQKSGRLIFSN